MKKDVEDFHSGAQESFTAWNDRPLVDNLRHCLRELKLQRLKVNVNVQPAGLLSLYRFFFFFN